MAVEQGPSFPTTSSASDLLIEAAYAEPKLRRLYPYTSHWSLNFSASTLLPHVSPSRGGSYDVVSPRGVTRRPIACRPTPQGITSM
ncbi:DUF6193 family natural product biosynthesis protein [Micromonospora sp. CPCC 205739]|uniref:DUF6193 family natural product biosynthesis protein n=1 Tax=unclassified Micromonospora TaxID=2617518 RepID=UPI003FA53622